MTSQTTNQQQDSAVTIGHVIGGSFGMAFIIANSMPMPTFLRAVIVAAAVTIMTLTLVAFGRSAADGSLARQDRGTERFNRQYWVIVAIEVVFLFGGMALLNQWRPSAIVGWIAFVVGLHFFWLARLWSSGSREISLVAAGLTVLGVAGLTVAFTTDSRDAVALISGVGSGVVLLAGSLTAAVSSLSGARAAKSARAINRASAMSGFTFVDSAKANAPDDD